MAEVVMSKRKKVYYLVGCLVTFIFYIIPILADNDIVISPDALGALANAAYHANLDWTDALSHTRYYGYGFFWIYSFLLKYSGNSYFNYLFIYISCSGLISITTILVIRVLTKYFQFEQDLFTLCVAQMPAVFQLIVSGNYICNETPLYILFWMLIWFLLKSNESSGMRKHIYTLLVVLDITWMFTCHERTTAVLLSVIIVILLCRGIYRRWIVSAPVFVVSMIIGYCFKEHYKNFVIARIWAKENMINTSALSGVNIGAILTPEGIKTVLDIFLVNILNLSERTLGMFLIACVVFIVFIINIPKRVRNVYCHEGRNCENDINSNIIFLVSMLTTIIVIGGLSVSWGKHVYSALVGNEEIGVYYRAYTYVRYYESFYGAAVLVGIAKLKEWRERRETIIISTIALLGILYGYMMICVYPNTFKLWGLSYRLAVFNFNTNDVGEVGIKLSLLLSLSVLYVMHKKINWAPQVAMIFMLVWSMYKFPMGDLTCSVAGASYSYAKEREDEFSEIEKIYVSSNQSTYQFMFNQYAVCSLAEATLEDEKTYIFSNYILDQEQYPNIRLDEYICLQLDDNEYVYYRQ